MTNNNHLKYRVSVMERNEETKQVETYSFYYVEYYMAKQFQKYLLEDSIFISVEVEQLHEGTYLTVVDSNK